MTQYISPEIEHIDLEKFMREALLEADEAGKAGEYPIGAVLVLDGEVISRGRARHKENKNQISHAELNALLNGGEKLWTDYKRAILFTTVEPCPMCLGAAVMADVPHIIYALHDAIVHSKKTLEANPYVRRHLKSYFGGVLEEASAQLIGRYDGKILKYMQTGSF
ncbi:MAG TPA: nucleoside deaminase [Anaerolineales bacterium]|nr:nucleoside deaminase [Anaerolineales bacterium]HNQ95393.1 nucleoside deaminase [Anaerolineales bacterium]HNS61788.1 nucleoside deaminase [Anaerolineales bacterium]